MKIERHRFHAMCPYFAMFPETFVEKHLHRAAVDTIVFDPFCGRGTTVFEALRHGRSAAGSDINAVAVCISRAKANPPTRLSALARIDELEQLPVFIYEEFNTEFFQLCYHKNTFRQICTLKYSLDWENDHVDCFLAALALGSLHGESHKSGRYFSNRMPRTISTKQNYSINWWKKHDLIAPERDVFSILRDIVNYRFKTPPPVKVGEVKKSDVRDVSQAFPHLRGRVGLVITSPPYLDTTNFAEDQWLRLWFLGDYSAHTSTGRGDHRHFGATTYWTFLNEAWAGLAPLLAPKAAVVIRIGGRKVEFQQAKSKILDGFQSSTGRRVELESEISAEIENGQLRSFRPASANQSFVEYDFVLNL